MFEVSQQFLVITHNANLVLAWMNGSMSISCHAELPLNTDTFKTYVEPVFPWFSIDQKLGLSKEYLEAGNYCETVGYMCCCKRGRKWIEILICGRLLRMIIWKRKNNIFFWVGLGLTGVSVRRSEFGSHKGLLASDLLPGKWALWWSFNAVSWEEFPQGQQSFLLLEPSKNYNDLWLIQSNIKWLFLNVL